MLRIISAFFLLLFLMVGCSGNVDLTCTGDAECFTKCQEHCGFTVPEAEAACNNPPDTSKPRSCYCGQDCAVGND